MNAPTSPETANQTGTVADTIADCLAVNGVARIFGVPGGGSSLDIIASAGARGIPFVLTRTETAAAIMASVTAEITGTLGVAMTTKGPGLANGINGLAYASLDRGAMIMLSDGFEASTTYMTHQLFDQTGLARPVTRAQSALETQDVAAELARLVQVALTPPRGPVYLEVNSKRSRHAAPRGPMRPTRALPTPAPDPEMLAEAKALLARSRKPVIIAGLQALGAEATAALRMLAGALNCPVFPTYKAKGTLPDAHPLCLGQYVGGAGEAGAIGEGDLIITFGADPVEFALQPWRYKVPVLELSPHPFDRQYVPAAVSMFGCIATAGRALAKGAARSAWQDDEMAAIKAAMRETLAVRGGGPITPQHVVDEAIAAAPPRARMSCDAGSHMLPVMAFWPANEPHDVLISSGLATMGFALPAAIAASLAEPERRVIAFTGDGGLMMCAGELATAAQARCNLTVVVMNDSTLTMIALKQRRQQMPSAGVEFSPTDFAKVAEGFGCEAERVTRREALGPALRRAFRAPGPNLVDVVIDPSGYMEQFKALRG
ncbi:MAG: thiamine pyrophosphate-binding protein [Alphaproteobacteria bacterium]|nr:thiamine pyrophosphate-binding protein [Alphaproteobacteria bacterium]